MDFRRDAIDLAIRFAPAPGRGLQGELLCREELFPVASPQLFRGGRMPDTLAALADYPLLHDIDAGPEQPWLGWRGWFERAGLPTAPVGRGPQFSDSVVLVGAAIAGLGIAIGRAPHVGPLLARGQLVRVTQENWISPWSYFLMAPPAHFRRPVVRTFVDWALEEAAFRRLRELRRAARRAQQRPRIQLVKWQQRAKEEAQPLPPGFLVDDGHDGGSEIQARHGGAAVRRCLAHQPGTRLSLVVAHQQLVRRAGFHRPGGEAFPFAARQLAGLLVGRWFRHQAQEHQPFELEQPRGVEGRHVVGM